MADRTVGGQCGWEDWATLSSEILVLVIKKVQERAAEDNAEMRRVVAMAGVCRSWRLAIQSLLAHNPFSSTGLLQFPHSLREPGPLEKPIQCVMRRKGGQFFLYQSDCGSGQELRESKCNFLMGACKRWRLGHILFMLSADRSNRCFSQKSPGFIGKLRSNFWGTTFVLWDFQSFGAENQNSANSKAWPVTFVRFTEEMVDGVRKRKMTCVVRAPRAKPSGGGAPWIADHYQQGMNACFSPSPAQMLWKWSFISSLSKSVRSLAVNRPRGGYLSLKEDVSKAMVDERAHCPSPSFEEMADFPPAGDVVDHCYSDKLKLRGVPGLLKEGQKVAMFTSKIPEWDVQRQCWSLSFEGRATLPSMHNFQLLLPASAVGKHQPRDLERIDKFPLVQQQTVAMQLGKIGKGLYALEFRYPLSALQAFNIALSSFATTVGVEP